MAKQHKHKQPTLYVAPEAKGRPRKIGCPEEMQALWEEYKFNCNNHIKPVTVIDKKSGRANTVYVAAPLTYTLKGFCLFMGISDKAFEVTYQRDEDYEETIALIEMEVETDARSKFEDGSLDSRLAGLWMSRYKGYSLKSETEIKGGVPVVLSGEDDLRD